MNKEEFLLKLRDALEGEIPEYEIERHVEYYRGYITDMSDGKTEAEKLDGLGNPRLIARTIIDTVAVNTDPQQYTNKNSSYSDQDNAQNSYSDANNDFHFRSFSWNDLTWYQKILFALIGVLAAIAIIGIIVVGVNIFFSLILPILIVVFIVRFVISLTRR